MAKSKTTKTKPKKDTKKAVGSFQRVVVHEIDPNVPIGSKCHHGKGAHCSVDRTRLPEDKPPHETLGMKKDDIIKALRNMMLARYTDDKHLTLVKQGKSFFHIGGSGHEAVQTAIGMTLKTGHDWGWPYYRDVGFMYALGLTPKEYFLLACAKEDDPSTGARQMPSHYGHKKLNVPTQSSPTGTQFLNAAGNAMANKKNGEDSMVYVSSGEGTTSQGEFYESVNWASREKLPVMFCIQDNGYAISVPREEQSMGTAVVHSFCCYQNLLMKEFDGADLFESINAARLAEKYIRSGKGSALLHGIVERLLPHSSSDDQRKYRSEEELKNAKEHRDPIIRLKAYMIDHKLATKEELDDLEKEVKKELDDAIDWALDQADPKPENSTKHVYDENPPKLDYSEEEPKGEGKCVLVDAVNHAMFEEMRHNDKMLIFGEDVADPKGGVFTATKGLSTEFGKERVFNSPLAEASIIGVAVGLAVRGYKPVVEIQFGDYIWPAFQQLRNEMATMRYRSDGHFSAPVVVRVAVGGYIHGGLCHSQNIEAFYAHIPGLKIAYPSTAADAKGLLKTACRLTDPVMFLEHKGMYRLPHSTTPEPGDDYLIEFGHGKIFNEGKDATIITWGMGVRDSLNAAKKIQKETGKTIEIIDLRTIIPWDKELVLESVKKTNRALIVHEDTWTGGFGGEISSFIAQNAFNYLDAPVMRVAGKDSPIPYAPAYENDVLPNEAKVKAELEKLLDF